MVAALFTGPTQADVLYATGFEASEGYILGADVVGLNSWLAASAAIPPQKFVITNDAAFSGTHALAFNPVAPVGQFAIVRAVAPAAVSGDTMTINVAFGTSDSGTRSHWGPIAAFSSAGGFIAQLIILSDGVIALGLANSGVISNVVMQKGVWGEYQMVLDFSAHTVSASFNGQSIGSGPIGNNFTDLGFFGAGINNALGGTEIGYLDAVSIASAVPEPASYALLGVGLAAVLALQARARSARTAQ